MNIFCYNIRNILLKQLGFSQCNVILRMFSAGYKLTVVLMCSTLCKWTFFTLKIQPDLL